VAASRGRSGPRRFDLLALAGAYPDGGTYTPVAGSEGGFPLQHAERPARRYAEQEVARIRKRISRSYVLKGETATKENFIRSSSDAGILHFAVHFRLNSLNPLDSELHFSATGPGEGENVLYAREVRDLKLNHTDLAVLSACNSMTGQLRRGEGLDGLCRSFFYAGVPSVVATLWPVPDSEWTVHLVDRFYQHLAGGMDLRGALRRAKQDLLDDDPLIDPYDWANFILVGRPDTIALGTGVPRGLMGLLIPGIPLVLLVGYLLTVRRRLRTK